ncbi:hypothetical protein LGQ10_18205 [Pseudomonas sp. L5B5]|uniref:hypothetical protein n=1 Tax=Pseudomonas sp. L5B5 TaxID=2883205 RepID=UPI001CFBDEEE|nr:hypothetical protein [Pseudomonas sp. L5B5]UCZ82304.1 hypothetical protein LGQ10_18205 [Pseudomonas sp. L5B5]
MTDARQTPSAEEQVLAHVREHSAIEPPAHLDALILAAARREAPAPRPGLWQRWLQACQRPRYQVAFASLFGVALIIGMVQRAPEPYPTQVFAPARAPAPAPVPVAAKARPRAMEQAEMAPAPAPAEASGALSAPAPAAPTSSFAMAPHMDRLEERLAQSDAPSEIHASHLAKRMAATLGPSPIERLDPVLKEVLRLWDGGHHRAAAELLLKLYAAYPDEDLDSRLQALRRR